MTIKLKYKKTKEGKTMKDTITQSNFTDEMIKHGFSYEGSNALFEYLTQYEEDCDHELEFDPIAFRCDFDEYENLKEVQENYKDIKNLEDLRNHTTVIEIPDTKRLIIQAY
tara:strand:+ start:638 stop:970 length:333 start_codon:yes stop_codon:yes gene_type:complete